MDTNHLNILILKRFCGEEHYPLQSAVWSIWHDDLVIEMSFEEGTDLHEDTAYLEQEPSWELSFPLSDEAMLQVGAIFENKDNEDNGANFYYCEHNLTYDNRLEILDRDGDRLLVRMTGICCDVNYYDGSRGNDELEIIAWVDKE
ncbi:MAG: hypothetical protein IKS51_08950 [Erysipelotrichaceae bacterium]|nr:hypothetical protein [Erysipelotrichaceae bacterium]